MKEQDWFMVVQPSLLDQLKADQPPLMAVEQPRQTFLGGEVVLGEGGLHPAYRIKLFAGEIWVEDECVPITEDAWRNVNK